MLLLSPLLAALPCPTLSPPLQDERPAQVRARYEELATARDTDALAKLWRENPDLILRTIDADLEGGLAVWEEKPEAPDRERIAELHDRALFAALVASEATGQPIFADYAASFVGWDDQQKLDFRTGQSVYRRALEELKNEEYDAAFTAARETRERASALGDWWGTAMGWSAEARALQGGGHLDEALVAYGMARQLYHDLGLVWSEYQNVRALAQLSRTLERWPRAHAALQAALAMARSLGDVDAQRELLGARAEVERKLGLEDQAADTEAEIGELGEGSGGR
jgi:hypothetical protein